VAGPIIDRSGARLLLIASSVLVAGAFVLFATGAGYTWAAVAAVVIGVGGGGLNVATNALVSDLYPETRGRMMSYLAAFFGVGAVFVPLAAASLGSAASIPPLLFVAAALALVSAAAYALLAFPPPATDRHAFSVGDIPVALAQPGVLLLAALLFFQTGNEAMVGGWISTYIGQAGWPAQTATAVLAGYWMAVIVGRTIIGRLHHMVAGRVLLVACGLVTVAGCFWLMGARSIVTLTGAALLTSLALSGVFPTTLALAGDRYRHQAATVLGAVISLGTVGGMVMPPILGRVSEAAGLRTGMLVPAVGAVMVTTLALVVGWRRTAAP